MKFSILLKIDNGAGEPLVIGEISRAGQLQAGNLGLTLSESKQLLSAVQQELVTAQFRMHSHEQRICPECGTVRPLKDYRPACFKSLFGGVKLRVPRVFRCKCADSGSRAQTMGIEGLVNWVSPELEFIQSQLAATIPYARAAELLESLLPVAAGSAASTVRRRTVDVGRRLDAELRSTRNCEHGEDSSHPTEPVTAMGLDGGYVNDCQPGSKRSFVEWLGEYSGKMRALGVSALCVQLKTMSPHPIE